MRRKNKIFFLKKLKSLWEKKKMLVPSLDSSKLKEFEDNFIFDENESSSN